MNGASSLFAVFKDLAGNTQHRQRAKLLDECFELPDQLSNRLRRSPFHRLTVALVQLINPSLCRLARCLFGLAPLFQGVELLVALIQQQLQGVNLQLLRVPGQAHVVAFLWINMLAVRAARVVIVARVSNLAAATALEAWVDAAAPVALDDERAACIVVGNQAKRLALCQVVAMGFAHTASFDTRSWAFTTFMPSSLPMCTSRLAPRESCQPGRVATVSQSISALMSRRMQSLRCPGLG